MATGSKASFKGLFERSGKRKSLFPNFRNDLPIDLQLEVRRIDLLYRQAVNGIVAIVLYFSAYTYASIGISSPRFLWIWSSLLAATVLARVIAIISWNRRKNHFSDLRQVNRWLVAMQLILFCSSTVWGTVGWQFSTSPSLVQQLFIGLTVVFICAGGIVSYAFSLTAVFCMVIPAVAPLILGLALSGQAAFQALSGFMLIYAVLALKVGSEYSNYVRDSLKLTVENARLVEDLKKEEEVRRERDVYEASNKAKSVFLANVSHEIRTPLAAINGFAELVLLAQELSPESQANMQAVLRNGKYLASLVNDLLDLSKIETGRLYIQKSVMAPEPLIEQAISVVRAVAQAKELAIDLEYLNDLPEAIESDPTRFGQVLINLLSNSVKFTDAGRIRVTASYEQPAESSELSKPVGRLRIRVADSGMGMSDDARAQLFQPFFRGSSPEVQRVPGSGLGLALSRNLARLLGGELELVSSEREKGSVFEFVIDAPIAELPVQFEQSIAPLDKRALTPKRLGEASILVVDDSPDLRLLMTRYLERVGAKVSTCNNGAEAVERALKEPFDVILMDIKMPVMDGYQATSALRESGYRRPIVALTAHANIDDRQLCYQAGCDAYVSKPVDSQHLLEILQKQLGIQPNEPATTSVFA